MWKTLNRTLTIIQGQTFRKTWKVVNKTTGEDFDLTGWTGEFKLSNQDRTITLEGAVEFNDCYFGIVLTDAQTSLMPIADLIYSVRLTEPVTLNKEVPFTGKASVQFGAALTA